MSLVGIQTSNNLLNDQRTNEKLFISEKIGRRCFAFLNMVYIYMLIYRQIHARCLGNRINLKIDIFSLFPSTLKTKTIYQLTFTVCHRSPLPVLTDGPLFSAVSLLPSCHSIWFYPRHNIHFASSARQFRDSPHSMLNIDDERNNKTTVNHKSSNQIEIDGHTKKYCVLLLLLFRLANIQLPNAYENYEYIHSLALTRTKQWRKKKLRRKWRNSQIWKLIFETRIYTTFGYIGIIYHI